MYKKSLQSNENNNKVMANFVNIPLEKIKIL